MYYFTLQSPRNFSRFLDRFWRVASLQYSCSHSFNKIDLLNFEEVEIVEELQEMYEKLGYQT